MTTLTVLLFSVLALSYIFSGFVCWLIFLNHFQQNSTLQGWQRYLAMLSSVLLVGFWPAWIINKAAKQPA
ncbi:hypothetical protein [Aliterella atlantica]|uniref:Uncharacterized protein n=1 Tax=Aliterella atlantica CENA595 TaxID=1618023 RepID=A0A0D8ZUZ6_9CYAN|nr:hypothetical protein [Aliterella atlantica]KJH72565.1 hypothetical protein UH38_05420 [Aliterella atlantica CENA595]